jgi:pimeloyl-ACP methyl ester carboxylesterase
MAPETITLPDGRALAHAEWGDPDGTPVFYLHGTPGSRLERFPDDELTRRLGIRLITHDRAGYGHTGRLPGRRVPDTTPDLVALADHLGIERFALAAISGGGPFALHACHALPDRVSAAGVLACPAPLDLPGAFDGMAASVAGELRTARDHPERMADHLAEHALSDSGVPAEDLRTLRDNPAIADVILSGMAEWTRQGWGGAADDDIAFANPWGFDPAGITVPVSVWQGEADTMVPPQHAEWLAATIPGATLHTFPGDAHVAMFNRQREVLSHLLTLADG